MAKFIEFHEVSDGGAPSLHNLDFIAIIEPMGDRTKVTYQDATWSEIEEPYEDVCKTIASAQGGLPIWRNR